MKNLSKIQNLVQNNATIMGILNVTPDSFTDGGEFYQLSDAIKRAEVLIEEGAHIIDIGGESTRPYAKEVSLEEEAARVIPVLKEIKRRFDIPISIDTQRASIMQMAIDEGADMINDVNALLGEGALEVCAKAQVYVCLMHKLGTPQTMQQSPQYEDVVTQVKAFLDERVKACLLAGIDKEKICLDVGFGFGKSLEHNISLLTNLSEFKSLGYPLLVGLSRKTMIGQILQCSEKERVIGTSCANFFAYQQGAKLFRVHDVKECVQSLKMAHALGEMNDA